MRSRWSTIRGPTFDCDAQSRPSSHSHGHFARHILNRCRMLLLGAVVGWGCSSRVGASMSLVSIWAMCYSTVTGKWYYSIIKMVSYQYIMTSERPGAARRSRMFLALAHLQKSTESRR